MRRSEESISKYSKRPDWKRTLGEVTFPKHTSTTFDILKGQQRYEQFHIGRRDSKGMSERVQSTEGNAAAALVSIKPCLLMFLRAEATFGNMDHNTVFIPYKSTRRSDEKWGLLSCARQVHYKGGVYFP